MAEYLYIIAPHPSGPCKIVITNNVRRRLGEIQNGNPDRLRVWLRVRVRGGAYDTEQRIHAALRSLRLTGEWFNLTVEEAVVAVRRVSGLSRRWSLSAMWARWRLSWRLRRAGA